MSGPQDLGIAGLDGIAELGRGGFGVVYKARQPDLNRYVAVKVLPPMDDDEARARFRREASATGSLSGHPNVVTLHGHGTSAAGCPYLVLEYLAHGSYADRVGSLGPLPVDEATSIGAEIGGVVESAHRLGLLHRDVKPANLMVGNFGEPKLGDFGIAQFADQTTDAHLTPLHAAPEALERRTTAKSDVYSLASTLYELLTGSPAFLRSADDSIHVILARLATEDPPDLAARGIPRPVAEAVAAGMAKDPSTRPTARMFAKGLNQARRELGLAPVAIRIISVADQTPTGAEPNPQRAPRGDASPVADRTIASGPRPASAPPRAAPRGLDQDPTVVSGEVPHTPH